MNDKIGSQSLTNLDSRKRSPIWEIERAVANECRSSKDGDVVDQVVVLEIKSFAVVESIRKLRLLISTLAVKSIPQTRKFERADTSRCRLHRWSFSRPFRSPITTSPPTSALHTRGCLTTVLQSMVPLPHHAQLNKLCRRFAPRSHGSRFKSISSRNCDLTPRNAPALSHWICPTSACSSSPFLLKNFRGALTIQSQCRQFGLNITEGRC